MMTVIEENWNYRIDLKYENCREFQSRINVYSEDLFNINIFKVQNYNNNGQSQDVELKQLLENNKLLRNEIDTKVEELAQQKNLYENFKQDQKLLSQEIKDTHEAFLMAKKYFKKYLKLYYTIESRIGDKQTIFLQFFTEARKDSENYSVKLLRDLKTESYQLLETKPKVKNLEELKQKLNESNDVPGCLCEIRQAFMKIKGIKTQ